MGSKDTGLETAELLMKLQLELEVKHGDGSGETGTALMKTIEPYIKHLILHHQSLEAARREARIAELNTQRKRFEIPEQVLSKDGVHRRPAAEGRNALKAKELEYIDGRLARLQGDTDGE